jgi:hypothetical protein
LGGRTMRAHHAGGEAPLPGPAIAAGIRYNLCPKWPLKPSYKD